MLSNKALLTFAIGAAALAAPAAIAQNADQNTSSTNAAQTEQNTSANAAANGATAQSTSSEEITDRSHPDYVRCRSERVIGSLAKRRRICMTNREWAHAQDVGNRRANELVDEMRATSVPNN